MKRKREIEDSTEFKADSTTIKNEDIKNLQKTFKQFFGSNSNEIKKSSANLKKRVYLIGFTVIILAVAIYHLSQKISFVNF